VKNETSASYYSWKMAFHEDVGEIPIAVILIGYFATICFSLQYLPQTYLNWKRKSVEGFNSTGILIKLFGASFFTVNSYLIGEETSVVLYGAINVTQHIVFMLQFASYTKKKRFYGFAFFPIVPYLMGYLFPATIPFTTSIKPMTQIFSHMPQLYETYTRKSSEGVSLLTQHLNLMGGLAGVLMYHIIPPKSFFTYMVYVTSLLQALSLYALAVYFDGWERLTSSIPYLDKFFHNSKIESPKDDGEKQTDV
jgi:uncharacterized protein with PQ loop repeat